MAIGSPQWMYNAGGYQIDNSLRFNDGDSAHLTFTPPSTGNRKRWTFSCWAKRGVITTSQSIAGAYESGSLRDVLRFMADGTLSLQVIHSAATVTKTTAAVFRDSSAWYHIVVVWDSANGTAGNRTKMYINGILQTLTGTDAAVNVDSSFNNDTNHYLGARSSSNANAAVFFDGYMAEVNFIDGVVKAPSDFGEYDKYGGWTPVKYVGAYGDEGWYLDFKSSGVGTAGVATVGADRSGNTNHWTSSALAVTDQMLDTPTNNFNVNSPLDEDYASNRAFSEGNLQVDSLTTNHGSARGTIGMSSGKWYMEWCNPTLTDGNKALWCGVCANDTDLTVFRGVNIVNQSASNGRAIVRDDAVTNFAEAAVWAAGTVLSAAIDMDNRKIWLGINNTYYGSGENTNGNPAGAANPTHTLASDQTPDGNLFSFTGGYDLEIVSNYGQDSSFAGTKTAQGHSDGNGVGDFFYAPPAGFLALCTKNLPEPTVIPSENFNTVLYTGDASDDRDIQVGFRPGWSWFKARNATTNHTLWDIMRGGTKYLNTNTTNDEATDTDGVDTGKTNAQIGGGGGFRLLGDAAQTNGNNVTFASWHWHASSGGGVNNTDGSVTSSINVNLDNGFSIVTYTATANTHTFGHGLSKTPEFIYHRMRDVDGGGNVFVAPLGSGKALRMDEASGAGSDSGYWPIVNSTLVKPGGAVSGAIETLYIAYCFHSVDGYSKIGEYTGNGNADGTFVYTGFRPAWLIVKRTDANKQWKINDNKRIGFNPNHSELYADSAEVEQALTHFDFLSNGFKLRTTASTANTANANYIYMAFAETPFKHSNAR